MSITIDEFLDFEKIQCFLCDNLIGLESQKCKAFDQIPKEILLNQHDHTIPHKGDKGIRFEAIK